MLDVELRVWVDSGCDSMIFRVTRRKMGQSKDSASVCCSAASAGRCQNQIHAAAGRGRGARKDRAAYPGTRDTGQGP